MDIPKLVNQDIFEFVKRKKKSSINDDYINTSEELQGSKLYISEHCR